MTATRTSKTGRSGFTLLEACMSIAIFVIVTAVALTGTVFAMKKARISDVQGELDVDARTTIENLKNDMRLSSLDEMFFYPQGPGPYQAVSFPVAKDDDGDGICEKDADGKLIWDKTIIYHIRAGTPDELRVTTFQPRDNTLTDSERQEQLDDVVADGDATDADNGENADTRVLFANLLEWSITPRSVFDGYSETVKRENSASIGYCMLDAGDHDFTFKVIGKNAASSGYKIGLDDLIVSSSGGRREAEAQLPVVSESGATAVSRLKQLWSGDKELYFPAGGTNGQFTLRCYNDLWHETNFKESGFFCDKTKPEWDYSANAPNDYIVRLEGSNTAWTAEFQTGDEIPGSSPFTSFTNTHYFITVRNLIRGADMLNGNYIKNGGGKCRFTFKAGASVNSYMYFYGACIAECTSAEAPSSTASSDYEEIEFNGNNYGLIPKGQTRTSDWVEFSIDPEKSYLVTFRYLNADYSSGWEQYRVPPAHWQDNYGAGTNCWITTDHSINPPSALTATSWSGYPVQATNGIMGIRSIEVGYEEEGTYESPVYDTQMDDPAYSRIDWNAYMPSGTDLSFKIRAGDNYDLSDAPEWTNLTSIASPKNLTSADIDQKRYLQFQATLKSDTNNTDVADNYEETPLLKDVTIKWPGETRVVDIGGCFTKGPDHGIFSVDVDNEPLRTALIVKIKIYKPLGSSMRNQTKEISSEAFVEIRPRNTGK